MQTSFSGRRPTLLVEMRGEQRGFGSQVGLAGGYLRFRVPIQEVYRAKQRLETKLLHLVERIRPFDLFLLLLVERVGHGVVAAKADWGRDGSQIRIAVLDDRPFDCGTGGSKIAVVLDLDEQEGRVVLDLVYAFYGQQLGKTICFDDRGE